MKTRQREDWFPIDTSIFPPLFHFKAIHGIAKVFIFIEMLLATLVVLGTLLLVVWSTFT